MHEASLVAAMCAEIEALAQKQGASRVGRIVVRVGELSGVEKEALEFAFEVYKREHSLFADSSLQIEIISARRSCLSCRGEFTGAPPCPQCGSLQTMALSGDELELNKIELFVEERDV